MATPPKPFARNDLNALRDARRHTRDADKLADAAARELDHMRQAMGRPDYSRMDRLLNQQVSLLAKISKALEEMWVIRAGAGQLEENDLAARLADVEAQLAELQHTLMEVRR